MQRFENLFKLGLRDLFNDCYLQKCGRLLELEKGWGEKMQIRMDKGQLWIFRYLRGWLIYLQNDEDLEKLYEYLRSCIDYGEEQIGVKQAIDATGWELIPLKFIRKTTYNWLIERFKEREYWAAQTRDNEIDYQIQKHDKLGKP